MPYIELTDIYNERHPRAIHVNTAHIQIIGTRRAHRTPDMPAENLTYIELAGRECALDVAESPIEILRAIDVAEAGHA